MVSIFDGVRVSTSFSGSVIVVAVIAGTVEDMD